MSVKQLIGLTIVLVIAAVVFFLAKGEKKRQERAEDQEKRVLAIERDDVTRVTVLRGDERITAEKVGDGWKIVEPFETEASDLEWNSIVRNVVDTRARDREELQDNLSDYGLDDPNPQVIFTTEDGEYTIQFGDQTSYGPDYYARRTDSNEVVVIFAHVRNSVDKEFFDLRGKKLLPFETKDIRTLEIIGSNVAEAIVVDTSDSAAYCLLQPFSVPADGDKVDQVLRTLSTGKCVQFGPENPSEEQLAERGLVEPATQVVVTFRDPDREPDQGALLIGSPDVVDSATRYWAMREGGSNCFLISEDDVEKLSVGAEAFRFGRLARTKSWDVEGILIERKQKENIEVAKDESGEWKMTQPMEVPGKAQGVRDFVSKFSGASEGYKIADYIMDASDVAMYGLADPAFRVTIRGRDSSETFSVSSMTDPGDGNPAVFAQWEGYPNLVVRLLEGYMALYQLQQNSIQFGEVPTPTPRPTSTPRPTLTPAPTSTPTVVPAPEETPAGETPETSAPPEEEAGGSEPASQEESAPVVEDATP